MAKREKAGAKAPKGKSGVAEPGAAKAGDGVHLISEAMLKKLLKTDRNKRGEIDGIVGELREMIGNAKEKHHLHTGVYAWIKKLDKMEAEKAAEWWDTLLAYADMSGVLKKIESVGNLPLGAEEGPEEDAEQGDDDAEAGQGNVRQFGGHARQQAAAE